MVNVPFAVYWTITARNGEWENELRLQNNQIFAPQLVKEAGGIVNTPFYSCVLSVLAFGCKRGWRLAPIRRFVSKQRLYLQYFRPNQDGTLWDCSLDSPAIPKEEEKPFNILNKYNS